MYYSIFDILIRYFKTEFDFEMVFSFGFRFGNKWIGLGSSSQFVLVCNSFLISFGVGIDGLPLMSHDSRVVNNSSTLALSMLSFVMV